MEIEKLPEIVGAVLGVALVLVVSVWLNPVTTPTIEVTDLSRDGAAVTVVVKWSNAHTQDHILDLDVVSGGNDDKVNVWRNDGTPFTGTWTKQEVGSHTWNVMSVAVGDLDGDGDPDLVSGGRDDKVNVWQNNGAFVNAWTSREVGSHTADVWSVAVGDLDGDGHLDLVSGGGPLSDKG